MSGPFDAAIELLKGCLEDCGKNGFGGDQIESMKASLRILEAAGKVDKARIVSNLERVLLVLKNRQLPGLFECVAKEVLPILEALPAAGAKEGR